MSLLTDFFPAGATGDPYWGPAGKPDYIVNVLAIGGGAGYSWIGPDVHASGGGGVFYGLNVAVYSGVSVPITVGAGGANGSLPGAGTPTGKGTPGSPSTFGCITAYGGGAGATCHPGSPTTNIDPTNLVIGDPGGAGGEGTSKTWNQCNCCTSQTWYAAGLSYNFSNIFGFHRGVWGGAGLNGINLGQTGGHMALNYCYDSCNNNCCSQNDPRFPPASFTQDCNIIPGFFCLDISGQNYLRWACLNPSPFYPSKYDFTTGIGLSRCTYIPICCQSGMQATQLPTTAGTGRSASGACAATPGSVWVVYPCSYPAATAPGATDCTPCVKLGYRAYKYTSPGSFTLS